MIRVDLTIPQAEALFAAAEAMLAGGGVRFVATEFF
jgi:hypothetical protein